MRFRGEAFRAHDPSWSWTPFSGAGAALKGRRFNWREPASWGVVRRLLAEGVAGILAPSFAHGATADDQNLVLWRWGPELPHKVMVYDPTGKLPKNQLSWT